MIKIIGALLDGMFTIIAIIFETFFGFINALAFKEKKTVYDADYSRGEMLSSWNKGFCLTGKRSLTIVDSFKNFLVIGNSGSYKSSGILSPSILKMRGRSSLLINDPSGELLLKTSGALEEAGYEIQVLNYHEVSDGYNPLARAKSVSDIQKISKMLVINAMGTSSKDPFFNLAAEGLLSMCIRYILSYTEKEYHTLSNVYYLVSAMAYSDKLDKLFVKADAALIAEYKAYLSYGDKTLSSIVATCRASLAIFHNDPTVAKVTSHDTIDFSAFRKKKIALFINTGVMNMRYYSIVTSLFLDQFFEEFMRKPPLDKDLPVFFLLDEASSLYFNNLQLVVSNIRKSKGGILQIYQSASQLIDLYGASVAKAITENCFAKVYMPGQPMEVARELSVLLGSFEYQDEKDSRKIRALATPNEIREFDESIILCGNARAIREKITPYFKQYRLLKLSKLPPYEPVCKIPFDTPPLIDLG